MKRKEKAPTWIGVDLGGTKLLIGEMTTEGKLLRRKKWPSGYLTQEEALALIQRGLDEFLAESLPESSPRAIGVGMIGRIDNRKGIWMEVDTDRHTPIPVAEILSKQYGLPCFLDNDVRSATKAEMLFGYGKQTRDMIYINIGTGIAAGFVSDGRLISGAHFYAGEIGHTSSGIAQRARCFCGREDCVEPVASGLGLDQCARRLAPQYPDTLLQIPDDGTRVGADQIFALYDSDALCRTLTDNAAQAIANLIMNVLRSSDPDMIVLGGGVVADGFLFAKIKERLNPFTIRYVTKGIHLTGLNPSFIGLMGACSNAILGISPAL